MNARRFEQVFEGTCEAHGVYTGTEFVLGKFKHRTTCPICKQAADSAKKGQAEALQRQSTVNRCHADAEIPDTYARLDARLVRPEILDWVRQQPSPGSLVLLGRSGNGKSSQAAAALKALADRMVTVHFASADSIVRAIDSASSFSSKVSQQQLIDCYAQWQVLCIDDVTPLDSRHARILAAVVERRYQSLKSMIVTTNCSPADLLQTGSNDRSGSANLATMQMLSRWRDRGHWLTLPDVCYRQPFIDKRL